MKDSFQNLNGQFKGTAAHPELEIPPLYVYLPCTESLHALLKQPACLCLQGSEVVTVWRMPEVAERPP